MKLNNINVGDVFANYKELCLALGVKELQGNSKIKQLKTWENYFEWEKDGHKFIITYINYTEGATLPFIPYSAFKSYKELCEVLGERVKSGTSKTAQLEHWKEFFEWERRGNSYYITVIHNALYVNSDLAISNGREKSYIPLMEKVLLNLMYEFTKRENCSEEDTLVVTSSFLRKALGLVNESYDNFRNRKGRLSNSTKVDYKIVEDFYSRSYSMFSRDIERVLKNLRNKKLLEYDKVMYIVPAHLDEDDKFKATQRVDKFGDVETSYTKSGSRARNLRENYKASKTEIKEVNLISWKTIRAMGYNNLSAIHANGMYSQYQTYLNENLINEMGIYRVYYAYELIFHDAVIKYLVNNNEIDFVLSSSDLQKLKDTTNDDVCNTLLLNAQNRVSKEEAVNSLNDPDIKNTAKKSIYSGTYLDSYEVLTDTVIKIKPKVERS